MVTYFLGFIFFWLAILTFILLKTRAHYQHLVSATKKKKLDEILDQVVDNDGKFRREIDLITKELKKIEDNTNFYFQKAGLVHYNPFNGRGEQSFVLALLNKKNSGFILNFIYTRDGLRVYTKTVKEGKGEKYQLSDEEKKAIDQSHS
ncbi:hypothetical protein COS31_02520 [Candidatus Roizmanbacteria bacterium CG02_land_8_20_14_3_00_36_15]|uniref:DUF4446 domain-containing protein n=2 Tax=Candidatus Roizmaniibacteriota TaxID=1752723 RepID=A0A2M8KLM2_9BACT|nr:MAG: hypothetical protein COS51_02835 [Candidatus Roizmanbacteria bacterium CG03_land_8_20_14_0_80_36_21]PIV37941.1 MAG: hypothetical protein COS31_02520 [Candidatus Roizmanbacteria bacterium CG02_land_8_20_14_3_00_36_15]PIY69911.1 MAG: hypothetical protein COY89_04230 [Candidatus Roizmanbacteria bacterium CG_4_10_14_0_8_um_filter_36_36]PJA53917.1 MAG: hypothetical protein CO166_00275 [Candidatus Roizmanbacteria bacterium CG_4_9_14_3_um_filter_36_11]PJC82117.1 MAG: hypothetical protein CO007